jgi:mRNA (guanine-N7-)-methyltransferase
MKISNIVKDHYNSRPQAGREKRQDSTVFHLRALNNWIKSQLIKTYTNRGDKVLDLCCGKGGDLLKWDNANVSTVIGIDIAAVSIEQAKSRYNSGKRFIAEFYAGDVFANDITVFINRSHLNTFDVVSCQFALHYSFETQEKAMIGLSNISKSLKTGGRFIATIPNSNWIVKKLRSLPGDQLEFGNEFFKIRFEQKKEYPLFGHCYWFALEDAIDDCPEYLIHLPTLKRYIYSINYSLAKSVGLEIVHSEPFHSYFYNSLNDSSFDLLKRMKVLDREGSFSKQEWEIAGVYMVIVFKKV